MLIEKRDGHDKLRNDHGKVCGNPVISHSVIMHQSVYICKGRRQNSLVKAVQVVG